MDRALQTLVKPFRRLSKDERDDSKSPGTEKAPKDGTVKNPGNLPHLFDEILALICTFLDLASLRKLTLTNSRWRKYAAAELFLHQPGNEWKWFPCDPKPGQNIEHFWVSTWYKCTVVSWNPDTMILRVHYVGYGDGSDANVDLSNPWEASKLREASINSSALPEQLSKEDKHAFRPVNFARRFQPFKVRMMKDPKPGQRFGWRWGDHCYESELLYVYQTRVYFRYVNYGDWNTCSDIALEIGGFEPLNDKTKDASTVIINPATFKEETIPVHQLGVIMSERDQARKEHIQEVATCVKLSPFHLSSFVEGTPFVVDRTLATFQRIEGDTMYYTFYHTTVETKTMPVTSGVLYFSQKAVLEHGEMNLLFPESVLPQKRSDLEAIEIEDSCSVDYAEID